MTDRSIMTVQPLSSFRFFYAAGIFDRVAPFRETFGDFVLTPGLSLRRLSAGRLSAELRTAGTCIQ